jgi:hypothetical protein
MPACKLLYRAYVLHERSATEGAATESATLPTRDLFECFVVELVGVKVVRVEADDLLVVGLAGLVRTHVGLSVV